MNASCPITKEIKMDKILIKRKFREIDKIFKRVNKEINMHDLALCRLPKLQSQNLVPVGEKNDLIVTVKTNVEVEADLVDALNEASYIIVSLRPKKYAGVYEVLLSLTTLISIPFIF